MGAFVHIDSKSITLLVKRVIIIAKTRKCPAPRLLLARKNCLQTLLRLNCYFYVHISQSLVMELSTIMIHGQANVCGVPWCVKGAMIKRGVRLVDQS